MTWYVTCDEYATDKDDPDAKIWTLSHAPDKTGWETDSGYDGYGLTKADATFLASAANGMLYCVSAIQWTPEQIEAFNKEWREQKPGELKFVSG